MVTAFLVLGHSCPVTLYFIIHKLVQTDVEIYNIYSYIVVVMDNSDAENGRVGFNVQTAKNNNDNRPLTCCLVEAGNACLRPSSNASYSKKIQSTVAGRKLKLEVNSKSGHMYICDQHKLSIQRKRKRRDSDETSGTGSSVVNNSMELLDLFQLQMNTLRRYKKYFKVTSRPGLNKAQLAEYLTRHLKTIPVDEKEALTYFIYMVKTKKSKLDMENLQVEQEEKDFL